MKNYDDFINEGLEDFGIIDLITDLIMADMPVSKIKELKQELQNSNESLLSDLSEKFQKWLSKKAVDYLVKSTSKYYNKQLEIVNMFDPTDFTNIDKCEFVYLGGGIDAVTDLKSNWRYWFEEQFSTEEVNPHVLYSEDAIKMSLSGSWKGIEKDDFKKPYIFNPLRNEIIRDDPDFQDAYKSFKDGDFDEPFYKNDDKVKRLGKFFNKNVVAFDLRAFTLCDTNFVKWDATAGSGTNGELQLSMNVKQNIFMWVDSKMDRAEVRLKVKHISPWTLGSVTKIVRGDEEVLLLIDSIKKMNQYNGN